MTTPVKPPTTALTVRGVIEPSDVFAENPDPMTEVRECAHCRQPALVCRQVCYHSLQGVSGAWETRNCICQSCGTKVMLDDPKRIRRFRLLGWVFIWAVFPPLIFFPMVRARKKAWARNPLVRDAPYPEIRYRGSVEASRRCHACGQSARPVSVTRHRTNGIPTGTEISYLCDGCGASFKCDSGAIFGCIMALLFMGGGMVGSLEAFRGPSAGWEGFVFGPIAVLAGGFYGYCMVRNLLAAAQNPKIK